MQHPQKKKAFEKQNPNKRRHLALWLTLGFLILAGALLALVPVITQRWPAQKTLPIPTNRIASADLGQYEADTLESITLTQEGGERYRLVMREGALCLDKDGKETAIVDTLSTQIINAATVLHAENTVAQNVSQVREYLPEMGLSPALLTAQVRYTDGTEYTLSFGVAAPETTQHYYRVSGNDGVYLCDLSTYELFSYSADMLLPIEQPTLVGNLIDHLTLRSGDEPLEINLSTDAAGNTCGALAAPFIYPLDSDAAQALITACENLRLGTKLSEMTDEAYAAYGFDEPTLTIEIHQTQGMQNTTNAEGQLVSQERAEARFQLTVGAAEGDFFYYVQYESRAYLVNRVLLSAFLDASADSLITRYPANMNGAELSSVTLQTGSAVYELHITRTERVLENNQLETDQNGNLVYDLSITLGDRTLSAEAYETFTDALTTLSVSGDLKPAERGVSGTPRWQLTLTTVDGKTRTLAGYPLDAFHDALAVDGVARHYLISETLESLLDYLK